jgi:geranylgeranyl transferase type-2 subunit beta
MSTNHSLAALFVVFLLHSPCAFAGTSFTEDPTPAQVLAGVRDFFAKTALPDGSFQPGIERGYEGMADTAYSDLAAATYAVILHRTFGWNLPDEAKTRAFFLSRQGKDGAFFNIKGTVDSKSSQARVYNTTQGMVALHGLGARPKYDPLPVFAGVLAGDYKTLPAYSSSFFPLAYRVCGKHMPADADRKLRATMIQAEDGYLNDHVAATFHAVHYYCLMDEPIPRAEEMLKRVLRDQKADGSWMLNPPSRDRHAGFDAAVMIRQLGKGRPECRRALDRVAHWALSCRNPDGGFGHYPGSPSDADAVYFQVGTLVLAGWLKPAERLPRDAHLLGWGHLLPVP